MGDNDNNDNNKTPIENGAVSLNDEDFQFFKNKLQQSVKEYFDLDNQILALRRGLKERNDKKKETSKEILDIMKKLGIDNLNVKEGRLVSKTTKQNKAISKATISNGLEEIFKGDDAKLQSAIEMIMQKRETVEKTSLKHYKNKNKSIALD